MDEVSRKFQTIVELIIEQRANSTNDVFRYDFSLFQKKLSETQDFEKYGIRPIEQRNLLKKLSCRAKYLGIDYVDEDTQEWKYGAKMIAEYIAPDFDPLLHFPNVYVYLPLEDVESLRYEYGLKTYNAKLFFEYGHFIVACNGKKYEMQQLTDDRPPARTLEYAFKHHDTIVSRDVLLENNVINNCREKSISKICKGSKPLLTTLKPFISINARQITIKHIANINRFELEAIANHAKRIK